MEIKNHKVEQLNEIIETNELLKNNIINLQEKIEILLNNYQNHQFISKKLSKYTKKSSITSDPRLLKILVENYQLKQKINIQKQTLIAITNNQIINKISNILLESTTSIKYLFILPIRLFNLWRKTKVIPSEDVRKITNKVIDLYNKKGNEAVENYLNSLSFSNKVKSDIYTGLARFLKQKKEMHKSAEFANIAFYNDPQYYRLKWLAFRINEAGDSITANILLSLLPNNLKISTWEQQEIIKIRSSSLKDCEKKLEKQASPTKEQINFINEYNIIIEENDRLHEIISNLKLETKMQQEKIEKLNSALELSKDSLHKTTLENSELQILINKYKKESDNLLIKHAQLVQELYIQFKEKKDLLPQYLRIIIGTNS